MTRLVGEVLEFLKVADEKRLGVAVGTLPPASGDQVLTRQVFTNLISNAVKFSRNRPEPHIELGSVQRDGECVYYVTDNGIGFDMQFYDNLFGVFKRFDWSPIGNSKEPVWASTSSTALLPVMADGYGGGKTERRCDLLFSASGETVMQMNKENPHIIIVEDNPFDAEITLETFNQHNSLLRAQVLTGGHEALEYIRTLYSDGTPHPLLILLDLKLPKVHGLGVLRQLRADVRTKDVPIVVFTSSTLESDRIESDNLGANSYVVKPVGFTAFLQTIGEITGNGLRRTSRQSEG